MPLFNVRLLSNDKGLTQHSLMTADDQIKNVHETAVIEITKENTSNEKLMIHYYKMENVETGESEDRYTCRYVENQHTKVHKAEIINVWTPYAIKNALIKLTDRAWIDNREMAYHVRMLPVIESDKLASNIWTLLAEENKAIRGFSFEHTYVEKGETLYRFKQSKNHTLLIVKGSTLHEAKRTLRQILHVKEPV